MWNPIKKNWLKSFVCLLIIAFLPIAPAFAQTKDTPQIGAQVWIEEGQTNEQIDNWFKILSEQNMTIARLFITWNIIEKSENQWDFKLYDEAFAAATKYGVKIVATLTPTNPPTFRGGRPVTQYDLMPENQSLIDDSKIYIAKVVERYKNNPALYAWMPQNEPGRPPLHDDFTLQRFQLWVQQKYNTIDAINTAWHTNYKHFSSIVYNPEWEKYSWLYPKVYYDWRQFHIDDLYKYLSGIAEQIRLHDPHAHIHVNPHALVGNLANNSYNFNNWNGFLNSLGASIHPAWHFGLLNREQYTMGVSYVCDLIRDASEPNRFWVTELSGGNSIYSAAIPYCPTNQDISQWVWTSIAAGADNIIFWLLNHRAVGNEAGEWSMLDFKGNPSVRLIEAGKIAGIIKQNKNLFTDLKPELPNITIIYSIRTMIQQLRTQNKEISHAGRDSNAHLESVLGYYKAFQELGVPVHIKEMDKFDWTTNQSNLVIVPHATMLSEVEEKNMALFVKNGGKLIISGLTGWFDPEETAMAFQKSNLSNFVGADMKDIFMKGNPETSVTLFPSGITLPAFGWITQIHNDSAQAMAIGKNQNEILAVRHKYGKGDVVWIPELIGLGAWMFDSKPLSKWLSVECKEYLNNLSVRLEEPIKNITIRSWKSGQNYSTLFINRNNETVKMKILKNNFYDYNVIYDNSDSANISGNEIILKPGETIVITWGK